MGTSVWYQAFWFTQLLILAALALSFFAFGHKAKRHWGYFAIALLIFIALNSFLAFYTLKHRQKLSQFKVINYHLKVINDLSDSESDKYSAIVIAEPNLTVEQLKAVILKANKQIRKAKNDASVIWITLFDSENALLDKLDKDNPSLLAQAQWKRKGYIGLLPQSFISNDNIGEIKINLNSKIIVK